MECECLPGPLGRALHSACSPHSIPLLLPTSLAQRPSSLAPEFPALSLRGPAPRDPVCPLLTLAPNLGLPGAASLQAPMEPGVRAWEGAPGRGTAGVRPGSRFYSIRLEPGPRQPGPLPNPGHSGLRLPCFFSVPSARVGWDPGCSVFYTADSFLGPYSWKRHFWV